jgi:hypothetical protein
MALKGKSESEAFPSLSEFYPDRLCAGTFLPATAVFSIPYVYDLDTKKFKLFPVSKCLILCFYIIFWRIQLNWKIRGSLKEWGESASN